MLETIAIGLVALGFALAACTVVLRTLTERKAIRRDALKASIYQLERDLGFDPSEPKRSDLPPAPPVTVSQKRFQEIKRRAEAHRLQESVGMNVVSRCPKCGTVGPAGERCSQCGCASPPLWRDDERQGKEAKA